MALQALIDTYTDEEFAKIIAESHNMTEVAQKLGYAAKSGAGQARIRYRIDKMQLSTEHFSITNKRPTKRSVDNIFIENSTADQKTLRSWYLKGQYTEYKCDICGQKPFWNGQELTLILDHKNGHNHDNRFENLHWVCPNCNQQLPTTNGKNIKRLKEENALK